MAKSKLQQSGERLSAVLKWVLASLLASICAFLVGFLGWVMNHSLLPPGGGGVWMQIVIPSAVTWIVVLALFFVANKFGKRRLY